MGAARTVTTPAKATSRARHICVALIEASGVGLYCARLNSERGIVARRLAGSRKALVSVSVSVLLLLSATRRPVKGLHGCHSWQIASSNNCDVARSTDCGGGGRQPDNLTHKVTQLYRPC